MSGHYELRRETLSGVQVMAIVWIVEGEAPMLMTTISEERIPLLAKALCGHLHGADAS